MNKVLILGASSFVGKNLLQDFNKSNACFTFNNNYIENGLKFNIVEDNISNLDIDFNKISHAVILVGDTEPDSCYADIPRSNELNINATIRLIDFLNKNNIKIIFCSTEFVFDGHQGMYTELDLPNPILEYGRQKHAVEIYLNNIPNSTILRLAKVYGSKSNDCTLFSDWKRKIENDIPIECANDQYFSPVLVDDIVKIIKLSIEKQIFGLFNISCGRKYSRIDLLHTLLKYKFKNHNLKIIERSIDDFELPESRPKDVSMNSDKARIAFNINFTTPEDFLKNPFLWRE
jgi:dTDP-4-dehydrorhamnose reductase